MIWRPCFPSFAYMIIYLTCWWPDVDYLANNISDPTNGRKGKFNHARLALTHGLYRFLLPCHFLPNLNQNSQKCTSAPCPALPCPATKDARTVVLLTADEHVSTLSTHAERLQWDIPCMSCQGPGTSLTKLYLAFSSLQSYAG